MRIGKWIAAAGAMLLATVAAAQNFPTKPVRIIVPFAPGGATDIVTRILAQKLTEAWGQTIVVDNRAGAGGNIGGELAAKAPADGYTLFMPSGSVVTANQHIYKRMPFNA
jgi:tripartite-type tricarboxylate transporter receptor subunit TctC